MFARRQKLAPRLILVPPWCRAAPINIIGRDALRRILMMVDPIIAAAVCRTWREIVVHAAIAASPWTYPAIVFHSRRPALDEVIRVAQSGDRGAVREISTRYLRCGVDAGEFVVQCMSSIIPIRSINVILDVALDANRESVMEKFDQIKILSHESLLR